MNLKLVNILIVEADPSFAFSLKLLLEKCSRICVGSVKIVSTGAEGLSLITSFKFEYIFISDTLMDLEGCSIIKIVDRYYFRYSLHLIALITNKDLSNIVKLIESGAQSFIVKDDLDMAVIDHLFKAEFSLNG